MDRINNFILHKIIEKKRVETRGKQKWAECYRNVSIRILREAKDHCEQWRDVLYSEHILMLHLSSFLYNSLHVDSLHTGSLYTVYIQVYCKLFGIWNVFSGVLLQLKY